MHEVGDVAALAQQFTRLHEDPALLDELRAGCLRSAPALTWTKAGVALLEAYREVVQADAGVPAVAAAAR